MDVRDSENFNDVSLSLASSARHRLHKYMYYSAVYLGKQLLSHAALPLTGCL